MVEPSPPGPENPESPISPKPESNGSARSLELRSEGGAGQYKGGYMGRYVELEEKSQNRSTYKQMNTVTGSEFFLYYAGGFIDGWWLVSATNMMYAGELRLNMTRFRDEEDKNLPPTDGVVWEYFDRTKREWVEDPMMTAGPFSSSCGPIRVTLEGDAKENQGPLAGLYKPLHGKWSAGRQVHSHVLFCNSIYTQVFQQVGTGNDRPFLNVLPLQFVWGIRSVAPDLMISHIDSASAGTFCPCEPSNSRSDRLHQESWGYRLGGGSTGELIEAKSGEVLVTCAYKPISKR